MKTEEKPAVPRGKWPKGFWPWSCEDGRTWAERKAEEQRKCN